MIIIDIIDITSIIIVILPNSGITKVPIISICVVPAENGIVTVLWVEDTVSSNFVSESFTRMTNESSSPVSSDESATVLGMDSVMVLYAQ